MFYDKMKKYYDAPIIKVSNKTNVEIVDDLLKAYSLLDGMEFNERFIVLYDHILNSLNQYVTLIQFSENGDLKIVDIEESIEMMRHVLDKLILTDIQQNRG